MIFASGTGLGTPPDEMVRVRQAERTAGHGNVPGGRTIAAWIGSSPMRGNDIGGIGH